MVEPALAVLHLCGGHPLDNPCGLRSGPAVAVAAIPAHRLAKRADRRVQRLRHPARPTEVQQLRGVA
jgi:hypothetical protein